MIFTFLMLSSLCFKQSVKTTFLTPDFSNIFRVLCNVNVIILCFKLQHSPETAPRLLTCLLDRSARSILLRMSRCGLTSKVSRNTGFLPDRGMCFMFRKKLSAAEQSFIIIKVTRLEKLCYSMQPHLQDYNHTVFYILARITILGGITTIFLLPYQTNILLIDVTNKHLVSHSTSRCTLPVL